MKSKNLAIVLLLVFSSAYAVDYQDVIIFRGIDGTLTASSQLSLNALKQEAREKGSVKIWIMFDMEYQPNPAQRSSEIKAAEAATKASLVKDIVRPSADVALQETPKGLQDAPGVMVKVTERGLVAVAQDSRVKHITYHP